MSAEKRERLERVRAEIASACAAAGRSVDSVRLIAVSKTKPWEDVRDFALLGQVDFGENYVQEALAKIQSLDTWAAFDLKAPAVNWHFIGALQSNKAKLAAGEFSLFHALDSLSLAEKLGRAASAKGLVQDCLVEVNVDGESSKAGIAPAELPSFLESLNAVAGVRVRGLMCIPDPALSRSPRAPFALLRAQMEAVNASGAYREKLTELSMGMSADFADAILEGATYVRVGTSLFGARERKA